MRDFESIAAFFSEREIDGLQAAIDARREARAPEARPNAGVGCNDPGPPARPTAQGDPRRGLPNPSPRASP